MAKGKKVPKLAVVTQPEAARERALALAPRPTKKAIEFLEILLNDCGFGTRLQRNSYLSLRVGREIRYLDDLTAAEASRFIDILKEQRDEEAASNGAASNGAASNGAVPCDEDEEYTGGTEFDY